MRAITIQLMAVFFLGAGPVFAQDIQESQVPSVIVNNFKKQFSSARDIDWERQGNQYNVDFEIGFFTDYEAWYTASGELIRYSEEIPKSKLPSAIKMAVKSQFEGYRIEDAKKFVENNEETYYVEIEKGRDEQDLFFSKDGKLL